MRTLVAANYLRRIAGRHTARRSSPVVATPNPTPTSSTPISTTIIEPYTVRNGDTLGAISQRYNISIEDLMRLNGLTNANALQIGQVLKISMEVPRVASADLLLPDSEVVYSPAYASFDVTAFANQYNGYLAAVSRKSGRRIC